MSQIELEIAQLAEKLQTLRLPHKLNQYRDYQRRLLSLRKLADNIVTDADRPYQAQLDQLQSKLDASVLCGVGECFLCGPQDSQQSNAAPLKPFPAYNRSVSANATFRPRVSQKPVAFQSPLYNKQVSYNAQLIKTEFNMTKPPSASVLPTPPESPATASVTSDDGLNESDEIREESKADVIEPQLENEGKRLEEERTQSPKHIEALDFGALRLGDEDSPRRQSTGSTCVVSPSSDVGRIGNNIFKSPKPQMQRNDVPKPYPPRTSSYRAYKDFVNNYADRNKSNQK